MLKSRIIPCLDVNDGRVVKGVKFQNLRGAGDSVTINVEQVFKLISSATKIRVI